MPKAPGRDHVMALLGIGFAIGASLRLLMLPAAGMFDVNQWIGWGQDVLNRGLADAYVGSYFPLQYQIFGFCARIARTLHWSPGASIKAASLVFDSGNFALILLLLRRFNANLRYALVYWLHPWFLVIFLLGYVDPQFSFFVLLSIWLLSLDSTWWRTATAGAAMGAATLMKPQAVMPAAAVMLYLCVRDRRVSTLFFFVSPIVLWLGSYELYFLSRYCSSALHSLLFLPRSYVDVTKNMPVLTAHMLNAWYPVAWALKKPEAPIWSVSSRIELLPYVRLDTLVAAVVALLVARHAVLLARKRAAPDGPLRVVAFASLIVPLFATGAHENHLFLGTALLVVVMAMSTSRAGLLACHGILAIEAANLELLYGNDSLASWARPAYSYEWRAVLSVIVVTLCLISIRDVDQERDAGRIGIRGEAVV